MYELIVYNHSIGQNSYHLVFRTKYNLKFFQRDYTQLNCERFLREAAEKHKISIYTIKVLPDHVHIFVELPPTMSVSKAAHLLKGSSSRRFFQMYTVWRDIVKQGHDAPHLWSRWRFSRSVGQVKAETIAHYIKSSKNNQVSTYRERQATLC